MNIAEVTILGSINVDFVAFCLGDSLPLPGQTVFGSLFEKNYGGKGANQAVQASRLGVSTRMIGRVGDDEFGQDYKAHLLEEGVICDLVDSASVGTGVAHITVASSGENSIVIVPGANGKVSQQWLTKHYNEIKDTKILLCQNEIPFDSTITGLKAATDGAVTTIFNPAPAPSTDDLDAFFEKLRYCGPLQYICPNETELAALVGLKKPCDTDDEIEWAANRLLTLTGCRNVIVTLGSNGCYHASAVAGSVKSENDKEKVEDGDTGYECGTFFRLEGPPVEAVDTTGAGDSFLGALAAHLSRGSAIDISIRAALHIASLSVCSQGAQCSYAKKEEIVEKFQVPDATT